MEHPSSSAPLSWDEDDVIDSVVHDDDLDDGDEDEEHHLNYISQLETQNLSQNI